MSKGKACSLFVLVVLLFIGAGCGSDSGDNAGGGTVQEGVCAKEKRGQQYSVGLTCAGGAGVKLTFVDAQPAPPRLGDNTWTFKLTDASGANVVGATVKLVPIMVDHGHGSATTASLTELGDGVYRASPVNLSMPGFWETTVKVTTASLDDEVKVGFCVE
jgi:YtkA-like